MCRAHCHRVIKLSGTLDVVAPEKELVENVHGVREDFLEVAAKLRDKVLAADHVKDPIFASDSPPTVYFIGKMLWSKGLGSLMELLKYAEESADLNVKVDMYGSGPDQGAATAKAKSLELDMPFHGPVDHVELGSTHKVSASLCRCCQIACLASPNLSATFQQIFVNPSTSEVLCTTSAEALAMGKFVILPSHPSNDFFAQFPNCLAYSSKEEFVGNLYYAITHSPEPLADEYSHALSWEAATQRLEAAGCIPTEESELMADALASDDAGIEVCKYASLKGTKNV
jgi:digalactosyldiacylglycerol synthase